MTKPTVGIGVLSWRAHDTIRKSLASYRDNGFLQFFDQRLIYFSDISDEDRALAAEFGWECAGGENSGIAGGMKQLAMHLKTDYVLLLQNDNPIVEDKAFAEAQLREAVTLLESGEADVVGLRHRWMVGEGFVCVKKYLKFYPARHVSPLFMPEFHPVKPNDMKDSWAKKILRTLRPLKAFKMRGRSIFIEETPELIYPDVIKRKGQFLVMDSAVMNFTDQCILMKRDFFLNTLMKFVDAHPSGVRPNGFQAPEIAINHHSWWGREHFKWAHGQGIFTHARFDGSFRPMHHAFEDTGQVYKNKDGNV